MVAVGATLEITPPREHRRLACAADHLEEATMSKGSIIESVTARDTCAGRGHSSIEATDVTRNAAPVVAVAPAAFSVGEYEVKVAYDGGERWGGRAVMKAV